MKPRRKINYLKRYANQTRRNGLAFLAKPTEWNAMLLFTSAKIAWHLALYAENQDPLGIGALADASQRIADQLTAIEQRNSGGVFATLHLGAEIERVFSDEPELRADLLDELPMAA